MENFGTRRNQPQTRLKICFEKLPKKLHEMKRRSGSNFMHDDCLFFFFFFLATHTLVTNLKIFFMLSTTDGYFHSDLYYLQMRKLRRWLILRQQSGFQGRPNKEIDTCYSFWIAAALKVSTRSSLYYHFKSIRLIFSFPLYRRL